MSNSMLLGVHLLPKVLQVVGLGVLGNPNGRSDLEVHCERLLLLGNHSAVQMRAQVDIKDYKGVELDFGGQAGHISISFNFEEVRVSPVLLCNRSIEGDAV